MYSGYMYSRWSPAEREALLRTEPQLDNMLPSFPISNNEHITIDSDADDDNPVSEFAVSERSVPNTHVIQLVGLALNFKGPYVLHI